MEVKLLVKQLADNGHFMPKHAIAQNFSSWSVVQIIIRVILKPITWALDCQFEIAGVHAARKY